MMKNKHNPTAVTATPSSMAVKGRQCCAVPIRKQPEKIPSTASAMRAFRLFICLSFVALILNNAASRTLSKPTYGAISDGKPLLEARHDIGKTAE
jgi:hypothetical protein